MCTFDGGNNIADITVEQFSTNVAKASASFVARLYSQPSLPRLYTQESINSVQSFLHHVDAVEACYRATSANVNPDITAMFVVLRNAFSDHKTEHRSMQYFKILNFLIEPENYWSQA